MISFLTPQALLTWDSINSREYYYFALRFLILSNRRNDGIFDSRKGLHLDTDHFASPLVLSHPALPVLQRSLHSHTDLLDRLPSAVPEFRSITVLPNKDQLSINLQYPKITVPCVRAVQSIGVRHVGTGD